MIARLRGLLLLLVAAAAIGGLWLFEPIPQDPAYHEFADQRGCLGVPHYWNVATNLPFLLVGALGWLRAGRVASADLGTHYRVLCAAIALVAAGSAWYHHAPGNATLVWDRLPMTIAFMTLFSALIADRVSWLLGRALLWPLVVAGIASIAWWMRTEAAGAGDLRAYALVQFLPMALMPLVLLLWRGGNLAARPLWLALAAYAVAKLFEYFDAALLAATDGIVAGHALKHLAAALATWWIVSAFQGAPARAL
jgi:hypothetical protein